MEWCCLMHDPRTYIKLHDGMPDHPKVDGLSDRAFRLLVETWCWCSRHLTDGKIPATTWNKRGTPASRRELLAAGLAEELPDGSFLMHDYLEHQRSADEVAELRAKRQAAGSRGGKAKAAKRVASAKQTLKQTGSKVVPETETETELVSDGSAEPTEPPPESGEQPPAQRLMAEWLERCAERPPSRVIGQVSRELKTMLDDGIAYSTIRSGLAQWHRKGGLHPATLPSIVHEVQQRPLALAEPEVMPDGRVKLPPLPKGVFDQ